MAIRAQEDSCMECGARFLAGSMQRNSTSRQESAGLITRQIFSKKLKIGVDNCGRRWYSTKAV